MARKTLLMKKRPQGMDYATYRASCAAKGMDPMESDAWKALPVEGSEDDDGGDGDGDGVGDGDGDGDEGGGSPGDGDGDEGGDDGDDDDDNFERGTPVGDLMKALRAAGSVTSVIDDNGPGREDYLTERFKQGVISKSEQRELARIWAGTEKPDGDDKPLRKSLTEILGDEDARVVDASPILSAMFSGLDESLRGVREDIAKSSRNQRALAETHLGLTKALIPVVADLERRLAKSDAVISALGDRLNIVERQPRQRRSATTSPGKDRPLAKSVQGGGSGTERGGGEPLRKGQVIAGLNTLTKSARDNGDRELAQRLVLATASYESTGMLEPGFRAAVQSLYT